MVGRGDVMCIVLLYVQYVCTDGCTPTARRVTCT